MALSLLFGRAEPTTISGNLSIGEIELDASLSESHQFDSEVTQYPVEDGSVITDHIQNRPDKLTINGFVSNTPVRLFSSVAIDLVRTSGNSGRFDALERIHRERVLVDIVTPLKSYTDMAMESLTVPRNAAIGDTLEFSATFIKVVKVSSELVTGENLLDVNGAQDQASSTKDAGKQNTAGADQAQVDQGTPLLRLFKGALGVVQ